MNPNIERILKEGELCKKNYIFSGIPGATGPTDPTGEIGPTGPALATAYLEGIVATPQTVAPTANVVFDTVPTSNNITYQNGSITLEEDGVYYIDFDANVTTSAGQLISMEVQRVTPTTESILTVSSGTYVNSGSSVTLNGSTLYTGTAGDILNIINTSSSEITVQSTGQDALHFTIFKIA